LLLANFWVGVHNSQFTLGDASGPVSV
jgi:hypothetical protein